MLFENRAVSASVTMLNAISGAREWLAAQDMARPQKQIPYLVRSPTYLQPEVVLCNSDAAWKSDWIIHSDTDHPTRGSSHCDFVPPPLLAEALALKITLLALQSSSISESLDQIRLSRAHQSHQLEDLSDRIFLEF